MFLNEIFDKSVNWRWIEGDNFTAAVTYLDDRKVAIEFNRIGDDIWYLEFSVDGETRITGGGDSLKIFGIVINAINQWLAKRKPEWVTFSANSREQSRVKMYRRMASRFGPGYVPVSDQPATWPQALQANIKAHTGAEHTVLARQDLLSKS